MGLRFALASALVLGCAPDPQPLRDPLDYLRVGADFEAEAATFAEQLRADGWTVAREQRGESFAALQAQEAERTLVRVWSRRGLVLTIDAPAPEHWRRDVVLAPPVTATDLDGDGLEEVVIGATDDALDRTCFALVRIDAEGFATEITPTYRSLGGDGCVEGFTPEPLRAMVVVRLSELAGRSVPRVTVPHGPNDEGAWVAQPGADFLERERARRQRALAAGELTPYRAAVELAALAHLAGEDGGAQLQAFDEALGDAIDAAASAARARIMNGWREEATEADAGPLTTGADSDEGPRSPFAGTDGAR